MKRVVLYLVVGLITFSVAATVEFMWPAYRRDMPGSDAEEIKLASLYARKWPVQLELALPTSSRTFHHPSGKFDPSGDYHPVYRMHESEKFTHFDLTVRRRNGKLVASGEIKNLTGTYYKFASISVTEHFLKFTTVNIRGVKYRFEGRFLGSGNFAGQTTDEGQIMLEGTLQKFHNGEKVAQTISPFLYFPGC